LAASPHPLTSIGEAQAGIVSKASSAARIMPPSIVLVRAVVK
jgi:hypothetical protein